MIPHLNTIKNRADKSKYCGTKLPYKLDNPYDNLMNYFGEKSLHILKYLNFTPNTLTLIGGIFMIFSIIFILKYKFLYASLLYAIAYWFDCVDGQYARYYGVTSKSGEKLDHFVDAVRNILTCISIYIINIPTLKKLIFFVFYVIFTLTNVYVSNCIQNYYYFNTKTDDKYHMKDKMTFCKHEPNQQLKYVRFFGSGTKILFIILFLLYLSLGSR
jgi:phosphatidylglycerophosphate synthase